MIYTLTFNPALDYIMTRNEKLSKQVRFERDEIELTYGGKGINSSFVLNQLDEKNKAIFPLNGDLSLYFVNLLTKDHIKFIKLNANYPLRINIKINLKNSEYEFNGPKESLTKKAKIKLISLIEEMEQNDTLMFMGSIHNDDFNFVARLSNIASHKNINLVYDLSSSLIKKILKYKPIFIKPNIHELSDILERKIETKKEIINGINELLNLGAQNVSVTMGSKGSINSVRNKLYFVHPIKIIVASPTGSGDSFVSGFVSEFLKNSSAKNILIKATSCATATASSLSIATREEIKKFEDLVKVQKI